MNKGKMFSIAWVVILVIVSFVLGFYLNNSGDQLGEMEQELQELKEGSSEDKFVYTDRYGERHDISFEGFSFPLTNVSRCELMNRALKRSSGSRFDLMCIDNLGFLQTNFVTVYKEDGTVDYSYQVYFDGCSGFVINEEERTIEDKAVCGTT
jgi:hypothetical protein